MVDDLIEAGRRKIGELHLDDRTQSFNRRANGSADNRIFADRRIDDTSRKLLRQIFGGLKGAAEGADILAIYEDAGIIGQRPSLRFPDRFKIRDAHGDVWRLARTSFLCKDRARLHAARSRRRPQLWTRPRCATFRSSLPWPTFSAVEIL